MKPWDFIHPGGQEVTVFAEFEEAAWEELKRRLGSDAPTYRLQKVWGLKVEKSFFIDENPDLALDAECPPVDTSRAARESVDHGSIQDRVMAFVEDRCAKKDPPITEEIEHALDMKHQTISASVNALVRRKRLRYGEGRKKTTSGCWAKVVEVV